MLLCILAAAVAVMMPSCRHNSRGNGHADDVRFEQLDSMLKDIRDIDSLKTLVQRYHDEKDIMGEMIALMYYGRILRHQSHFDEAIDVHQRSLEIATTVDDTLAMISAMNHIGADYRRQGELSKANGSYYKALQLGRLFSDQNSLELVQARSRAFNGLGDIEIELRHYPLADSLLHEGLRCEQFLGNDEGMSYNYNYLGNIKRAMGQTDSAWKYYQESLKHARLAGNENVVASCYLNFGKLYNDERNYSHAQVEFNRACDELKRLGDTYDWLEASLSLAGVSIKMGEIDEARSYLREAEPEALRINSKEHQAKIYRLYYELALMDHNPQQALDYFIKSDDLYDSIYGLEKSNEIRYQLAEYEANVKQGEMSSLNKDIEHLHHTRNWMMLFTALLVLMGGAIIAALLYAARVRVRTQRKMRQVEETRSLFFTNVVHQLRTPLTAIMGATDGIVAQSSGADGDESAARQHENVEIIERQGNHLLLLVDRILEVGGVRSDLKGPDWRTGDVVGYIRMIVESYRETCVNQQIELTYTSSEKEVEMDIVPNYLNTIVGNFIENAISYSNDYCKISVTSHVDGKNLVIKVSDNGIGIDERDLPHVFEPFYRAAAAEHLCEGVGIGLTVVRDMTAVLGGTVGVESTLGSGSVFTVTLPLSNRRNEVHERLEMVVNPVRKVVRKHHEVAVDNAPHENVEDRPDVLIVEDHNDVARLIGAALESDFRVHYASNGEQGLASANELVPDLIITDIKMPIMDGLELCRRVKASRLLCHIPVIVLSARTSGKDRIRGIEAGADVYMVKPFNADEMKAWSIKLLESRKILKSIYSNTRSNAGLVGLAAEYQEKEVSDRELLDTFARLVEEQSAGGKARLNLDRIARQLKMGESQLKRRILELTGKNAVAYIAQLRMEKAMRLLREHPNMLIGDIAEQCGFGDVAYFSRVFRQHYKMTPTQARQNTLD